MGVSKELATSIFSVHSRNIKTEATLHCLRAPKEEAAWYGSRDTATYSLRHLHAVRGTRVQFEAPACSPRH
jgi:hypothetical protein